MATRAFATPDATGQPAPSAPPAEDATADAAPVEPGYWTRLGDAIELARAGRDAPALAAFTGLVDAPAFANLAIEHQRATLDMAAWAAIQREDRVSARRWLERSTALQGGDAEGWYLLSQLEVAAQRYEPAAHALIRLAEGWPEMLNQTDAGHIYNVRIHLDGSSPARLTLLQALFDANWHSTDNSQSGAWYDLAEAHVARGDTQRAAAALKRIITPEHLILVRSDKRFDGLIDPQAWAFNPGHAASKLVDELRLRARLNSDDLNVRAQLSYALLTVGANQDVIELADEADRAIASATEAAPAFRDLEPRLWLHNNRAIALRRLGRIDEAIAELEQARKRNENGELNVSQALNLGDFYCRLGRAAPAREAIAKLGPLSGFGRLIEQHVRFCAALMEDDPVAAATALEYLRAHRGTGQTVYLEALLRGGKLKAAAELLTQLLAQPSSRTLALGWVQDYASVPPLPNDVAYRDARKTLLARGDVQAAIARVGRAATYPLHIDAGM